MATNSARVVAAGASCLAPGRPQAAVDGGSYGRMFDLPALSCEGTGLDRLGATGGFCDGAGMEADATVEAGWPFFGQYVAHDLTADRSPLRAHADLAELRNARVPRANLESLYGGGPVGTPYLYRRTDPAKLLEHDGDVPRNEEGIALIGDPRNDVHVFLSQMHVAFIAAHNRLVDAVRAEGVDEAEIFDRARRSLGWHYQWLIVNDYLPGLVGSALVHDVLDGGPRFYPAGAQTIPVEFADAAFRYGHSQIRQHYQLRPGGPVRSMFPDLMGFGPIDDRTVDWSLLFDVAGRPPAQRAKVMDGALPPPLIVLPEEITGTVEDPSHRSLATRDLVRGRATSLPSGEAIARSMGIQPLSDKELGLRVHGWHAETPLWLYVLREAHVRERGDRLGEVGGRIVAEVLVGIIRRDPESYLQLDPEWNPTLPARGERFRLTDILCPTSETPAFGPASDRGCPVARTRKDDHVERVRPGRRRFDTQEETWRARSR